MARVFVDTNVFIYAVDSGEPEKRDIARASLDELAAEFDLSQFGASPTKFDAEDLWPLTREGLELVTGVYWDLGDPETRYAA